jgi:hypothetical protein
MASVLQVATIKDSGGNANAIEIANSSANVTINNLTSSTGFPSGMVVGYEKNQTTPSKQSSTLSYADITGSSITYTPTTGSSYIVYECSFVTTTDHADTLPAFRFLIDGSVTKNGDHYAPFYHGTSAQMSTARQIHRMIYSASGWTSDKVVKMQFRAYSANGSVNSCQLHNNHYNPLTSDGSTMNSTDKITDVDVTIYSVI